MGFHPIWFLAAISELLQLEDLESALHLGSHGWRAEIKQFVKTNSQGSLIRAATGLPIGENILDTSVFDFVELPHTGIASANVSAAETQVNNPFAAVRQVRLKRQ